MKRLALVLVMLAMISPTHAKPLLAKEKKALKLASEWMAKPIAPKQAENGTVIFQYGATLPTVICAPLKLCDIALQAGEIVKNVRLGDTVRWVTSPAISGPKSAQIIHATVKPTEPNLETTLLITTDRRTYQIRLLSKRKEWMPNVAFEYPEDQQAQWDRLIAMEKAEQAQEKRSIMPKVGMHVKDLNFKYLIEGKSSWKPVRVFNNESHTFIDLPKSAKFREAPILLIKDGKADRIVVYRIHGERYIVDSLFDHAELISGVGSKQQKVTIKREGV